MNITTIESKINEEKKLTILNKTMQELENRKNHSAWDKGVTAYAKELLQTYIDNNGANATIPKKEDLLNGADNWHDYSYGGSSLIYDCDIAERLCTPSELKKTHNGERRPNNRESWLDVQARALNQACLRVQNTAKTLAQDELAEAQTQQNFQQKIIPQTQHNRRR